jgi:hypothetical protein
LDQHIKVLGVLNIVWGSLGALCGLIIMIIFGGAYGIVAVMSTHRPEAAMAMPIIAIVGGAIALLLLLLSAPSVVAGIALLYLKPWARPLAIVVSALHLLSIPFGTALGIYGLWVLLSQKSASCFTADLIVHPTS